MSTPHLEFEKDIAELEAQIARLQAMARKQGLEAGRELRVLERRLEALRLEAYRNLTPVERVQLARHPKRPYALDYIEGAFTDFVELHGDRLFRDDEAVVGGWARLEGRTVMVIGHQKGRDMKQNLRRNFGMPHPEGYRKALRLMRLAEKFGHPIVTLIDTPGAYPGIGAEERGQGEAIAMNLREMARLRVPTVAVVIGEGGSGGALALGVADRVLMLENATYSVISPEGCAAILWKTNAAKDKAAEAMKITAADLAALGVIDEVVPEPLGGAHTDPAQAVANLRAAVARHVAELERLSPEERRRRRWEKYERMGVWREEPAAVAP
ncbi:MAG: acetyl-CoA carboxylase carboxyltransferase subunit alpha [Gemmatimonadetes bacterium]|nr:acetyl-CoA carboxylase carboxyltransferase subunit alpha [Gemmatimonadota bacterium]